MVKKRSSILFPLVAGILLVIYGLYNFGVDNSDFHPAVSIMMLFGGGILLLTGIMRTLLAVLVAIQVASNPGPEITHASRQKYNKIAQRANSIRRQPSRVPAIIVMVLFVLILFSLYNMSLTDTVQQSASRSSTQSIKSASQMPDARPAAAQKSATDTVATLHQAIRKNDVKNIIAILSRATADEINTVNHGMTSVMLASSIGNPEVVDLLLQSGADPNKRGSQQRTALQYAVEKNRLAVARLLVQHGADINGVDNGRLSPLVMAADRNYEELALFLIAAGADVNIQHVQGWTALIDATRNGNTRLVRQLLEAGADVHAKTSKGLTAADYAQQYDRQQIRNLLKQYSRG